MDKFICIHGHFYQPPRENPWLETIELQDSAAPYHDWNQRIMAECYAPNAAARILDGNGRIEAITSNFSQISFNFGPTLLSWMKEQSSDVYEAILASDRLSREKFSGHGSAIAQVYNHIILPLANPRDKYTQVLWGIRDFEHRFGRAPEGMWLAETAADTETLETLAKFGIKFTILAPTQASKARELGKRNWRDVNGGHIDPTRSYRARLPSKASLALFFYDGPVSQAVAFEKLLMSGEKFAHRLTTGFDEGRQWDQLVNIATDGESYGHHHRHGEMALAYALRHIESKNLARLTNYGEYLESHPPTHEVQIHEKSSWSCSHGVSRWMADCGCNSGGHAGWKQGWRAPLRNALDWLRDEMAPLFESKAAEYLKDPWRARDEYISVILDRSPQNREKFFAENAARTLYEEDQIAVLKLMELQRHAMLMYTSCGWFFDEISGIESVQVVQYAARALQLAEELFEKKFEAGFLDRFQDAKSNLAENQDGRRIYERFVKPVMVDAPKAVAHYGISSMFEHYADQTRICSFRFEVEHRQLLTAGKTRLAIGRTRVISEITCESEVLAYAILHMGEHNITGGVRHFDSAEEYERMVAEIKETYESADFAQTVRVMDRHFGKTAYSLNSLFKDEQRRILDEILASTRDDLENRFRLMTERYGPLMKFLQGSGAPLPKGLGTASDFVLHSDIRRQLDAEPIDLERLRALLQEALAHDTRVLDSELSYAVKNKLERMIQKLAENPAEAARMREIEQLADMVMPLPLGLNLWKVQNTYWKLMQEARPGFEERATMGDEEAQAWCSQFASLGERLGFAVKAK
jgi:alpha-amylase/alpha-mannosidase (GH57 family)